MNDSGPLRIAVLISGGGTTLQNLIDRIQSGSLAARIVQVVSSHAGVTGNQRAERAGLPLAVHLRKDYPSTERFSQAVFDCCEQAGAELVLFAGWLKFIRIPANYAGRVMNIHPSLLPAFGGKGMFGRHVHEAVLHYGVKVTGCTVHFADNQYDNGPIILQRVVEVQADDDADRLAARVFEQECNAYPEAIRLFAEGRLAIEGRQVRILTP